MYMKFRSLLLIVFLLIILINITEAKERNMNDIRISIITQIAKIIIWPKGTFKNDKEPIILGVITKNNNRHNNSLKIKNNINGRSILVKQYKIQDDLQNCHLIFFNIDDSESVKNALKSIAGKPVVTVSDIDAFFEIGGMIQLTYKREKLIKINVNAFNKLGITWHPYFKEYQPSGVGSGDTLLNY